VLVYIVRYPSIKLEYLRNFVVTINSDIDSNPIDIVDLGQAWWLKLECQNSLNRDEAGLPGGQSPQPRPRSKQLIDELLGEAHPSPIGPRPGRLPLELHATHDRRSASDDAKTPADSFRQGQLERIFGGFDDLARVRTV
jgi:hypothetical protein